MYSIQSMSLRWQNVFKECYHVKSVSLQWQMLCAVCVNLQSSCMLCMLTCAVYELARSCKIAGCYNYVWYVRTIYITYSTQIYVDNVFNIDKKI